MNHAKLETYRIFDASIVPVCTGGLRVPDSGFRAALRRKVADTRPGSWGAPQRQGASDGWGVSLFPVGSKQLAGSLYPFPF